MERKRCTAAFELVIVVIRHRNRQGTLTTRRLAAPHARLTRPQYQLPFLPRTKNTVSAATLSSRPCRLYGRPPVMTTITGLPVATSASSSVAARPGSGNRYRNLPRYRSETARRDRPRRPPPRHFPCAAFTASGSGRYFAIPVTAASVCRRCRPGRPRACHPFFDDGGLPLPISNCIQSFWASASPVAPGPESAPGHSSENRRITT